MSDQEKKETEVTKKTFNIQENDFSGNKGNVNIGENITIGDKISNQYRTVNKVIRQHPIIGVLFVILFIIGILVGGAFGGDHGGTVAQDEAHGVNGDAPVQENVDTQARLTGSWERTDGDCGPFYDITFYGNNTLMAGSVVGSYTPLGGKTYRLDFRYNSGGYQSFIFDIEMNGDQLIMINKNENRLCKFKPKQ